MSRIVYECGVDHKGLVGRDHVDASDEILREKDRVTAEDRESELNGAFARAEERLRERGRLPRPAPHRKTG